MLIRDEMMYGENIMNLFGVTWYKSLTRQFTPKSKNHIFLLSVELFISLDSFGVSCLVLEILAVEISAFSLV